MARASLFLNFQGGMNSFNMIVPHSGKLLLFAPIKLNLLLFSAKVLYLMRVLYRSDIFHRMYKSIRGSIALEKSALLTIALGGTEV